MTDYCLLCGQPLMDSVLNYEFNGRKVGASCDAELEEELVTFDGGVAVSFRAGARGREVA